MELATPGQLPPAPPLDGSQAANCVFAPRDAPISQEPGHSRNRFFVGSLEGLVASLVGTKLLATPTADFVIAAYEVKLKCQEGAEAHVRASKIFHFDVANTANFVEGVGS